MYIIIRIITVFKKILIMFREIYIKKVLKQFNISEKKNNKVLMHTKCFACSKKRKKKRVDSEL